MRRRSNRGAAPSPSTSRRFGPPSPPSGLSISDPPSLCREARLRAYYGERYDARANVFDWDLTMKLNEFVNGTVVHPYLFKNWRETGIAFEFRDSRYECPNRTLSAFAVGKEVGCAHS